MDTGGNVSTPWPDLGDPYSNAVFSYGAAQGALIAFTQGVAQGHSFLSQVDGVQRDKLTTGIIADLDREGRRALGMLRTDGTSSI